MNITYEFQKARQWGEIVWMWANTIPTFDEVQLKADYATMWPTIFFNKGQRHYMIISEPHRLLLMAEMQTGRGLSSIGEITLYNKNVVIENPNFNPTLFFLPLSRAIRDYEQR